MTQNLSKNPGRRRRHEGVPKGAEPLGARTDCPRRRSCGGLGQARPASPACGMRTHFNVYTSGRCVSALFTLILAFLVSYQGCFFLIRNSRYWEGLVRSDFALWTSLRFVSREGYADVVESVDTRDLNDVECSGGNARCRTAQIRGTLSHGNPEPSPSSREGVETRRAAPKASARVKV